MELLPREVLIFIFQPEKLKDRPGRGSRDSPAFAAVQGMKEAKRRKLHWETRTQILPSVSQ